jgi:hypothetical protein
VLSVCIEGLGRRDTGEASAPGEGVMLSLHDATTARGERRVLREVRGGLIRVVEATAASREGSGTWGRGGVGDGMGFTCAGRRGAAVGVHGVAGGSAAGGDRGGPGVSGVGRRGAAAAELLRAVRVSACGVGGGGGVSGVRGGGLRGPVAGDPGH